MRRFLFIFATVALIAFLMAKFPYAVGNTDDKMRLVYLALLVSVGSLGVRRLPLNQTMLYGLVWLVVILGIVFAYSYKDEFMNSRIMAELLPNQARINSDGSVALRSSSDGHYHVEAKVNGVAVNFMIDTGASDVVLSKEDAERIGINTAALTYSRTYQTANGATGGAAIQLKRLQIGSFILDDFPASVNEGELSGSLLGMTALKKLGDIRIEGDQMVIGR